MKRVTDFFQKNGTSVTRSDDMVETTGTIEVYFSIMCSDNKVFKNAFIIAVFAIYRIHNAIV